MRHLQVLQAVEERHKDEGLVLLAVNMDAPKDHSRIPDVLKEYHLSVRVLLGDPGSLKGYDTSLVSALYIIDRNGLLAGTPGTFADGLEKKVEACLPDLLAGRPTAGSVLWTVETAPRGFGLLWRQPLDSGINDLAIAPSSKDHPAEIGLLTDSHVIRYSASGDMLGDAPLDDDYPDDLRGADLDGDEKNEWTVTWEHGFTVLDGTGERYCGRSGPVPTTVIDFMDLNGDGSHEIVVQEGPSVFAYGCMLGDSLWRTPSARFIQSVVPGPSGTLLVQNDHGIQTLDRRGLPLGKYVKVSGEGVLKGTIDLGGGRTLNVFGPPNVLVDVRHDFDGDGREDIMVTSRAGIAVYSQDRLPLLVMRIAQNQHRIPAALEDLDDHPGDELVLAIPDYGIVALGIRPESKPITSGTDTPPVAGPGTVPPSPED